jgi:hypothetical protein
MTTAPALDGLTLGDLEYYENKTGQPITAFDAEGTALARPMITMCALMLYRSGAHPTRDDAYAAASDLTMEEATRLIKPTATAPDDAGE